MTAQRKTDIRLLLSTYLGLDGEVAEYYTPESSTGVDEREWTALEPEVADAISEVAQVTPGEVGLATSIFSLGLDSISVIQLCSRLANAGYMRLDVSLIMRNLSVGSIANLLQASISQPILSKPVPSGGIDEFVADVKASVLNQLGLSEDGVKMIVPYTPLQEAMLSPKRDADSSLYYNHTTLNLNADPARLRNAWELMLKTHDIRRTCSCAISHPRHVFVQVVLKEYQLPWSSFQLEAGVDIVEVVNRRITSISESLGTSKPPYAFSLLQTPEKKTLIMLFHHSLYDGFAMDMLLDDLRSDYQGLGLRVRGAFKPFLEYIDDQDLTGADEFRKKTLEGLEPPLFPYLTGLTTATGSSLAGMGLAKSSCSRSLTSVEGGCRGLQTSLLALGQAAWARLLSVYTGETDICFGNVVSGLTFPSRELKTLLPRPSNGLTRVEKQANPTQPNPTKDNPG